MANSPSRHLLAGPGQEKLSCSGPKLVGQVTCATEEVRARQSTPIIKKKKERKTHYSDALRKAPPGPTSSGGPLDSCHRRQGVGSSHPGPRPSLRMLVPAVDLPGPRSALRRTHRSVVFPGTAPTTHTHILRIKPDSREPASWTTTENLEAFGGGVALYIPPQYRGSWKTSQFCLGTEGSLVSTVNSMDAPQAPSVRRVQPRVTVR